MDIKRKVQSKNSQGNAAAGFDDPIARACDWSYGRATHPNNIEDEKREEDLAFGVPHGTYDFDPPSVVQKATDAAKGAYKAVADTVKNVRDTYRGAVDESKSLGKELPATREMYRQGQQALDQDKPQK